MARAFSAAGMKVVIAYLQDEQLPQALQFFREPNAGVHAVKLDVDGPGRVAARCR